MDNSNLNSAHYHGRRAENHFGNFRFDKAMENYEKAARLTEEAMKYVSSPAVHYALKQQIRDHRRQVNFINLKKALIEKVVKEMERQREVEIAAAARKRSPKSVGSGRSSATERTEDSSPKQSSKDSVTDMSSSSIEELEMHKSDIPQLAPLELPPLLDFESFLSVTRPLPNDL